MKHLEQSGDLAQKYKFYRTVGQSRIDLAGLYRDAGDLKSAEERASVGVEASRRVGDRYYLPRDLTVLADLKAQRGSSAEAAALYENAEDVIDGMLVNSTIPSGAASSNLRYRLSAFAPRAAGEDSIPLFVIIPFESLDHFGSADLQKSADRV